MATQEERLTALEQEQAKYSEAVSDLNHHVTILTGIMSRQEWDIREMKSSLRAIDGRLSSFEQGVNGRFEEQGKKLDQIMLLLNTLTSKPE
jgi:uncharacterized coiled-coil protein SlyX